MLRIVAQSEKEDSEPFITSGWLWVSVQLPARLLVSANPAGIA
jgi:hypothetical protein